MLLIRWDFRARSLGRTKLTEEAVADVKSAIAFHVETLGRAFGKPSIGARSNITSDKTAATTALEAAISRVRFYLWATLPGMFKDALLHNYGFVPRQEPESERQTPPTTAVVA